jgi:hypothetical protein
LLNKEERKMSEDDFWDDEEYYSNGIDMNHNDTYEAPADYDYHQDEVSLPKEFWSKEFEEQIRRKRENNLDKLLEGPVKDFISEDFVGELEASLEFEGYFENTGLDEDQENFREIAFLASANRFLSDKNNANYRGKFIEPIGRKVLDNRACGKYFDGLIGINDFKEAQEEVLEETQEDFRKNSHNIPKEVIDEFEKKYGSVAIAEGGPFLSYAYRRIMLGEENPKEFYGRDLFRLKNEMIEKFKGIKDIEQFADGCFGDWIGCNVFSNSYSNLKGSGAISDGIPATPSVFQDNMDTGEGTALAFINTDGYCVDDSWLYDQKWLQDILTEIHKREFPELFERTLNSNKDSLDNLVRSESKKNKIRRLCNQYPSFDTWVGEVCKGNTNYMDNQSQNKEVTKELQGLGINTDVFYHGIKPLEFVVEEGGVVNIDEVKKRVTDEYRASLEKLLSGDIIHGVDRLESKIGYAIGKENGDYSREEVLSLNDEKSMKKVCNICTEYIAKSNNVKNSQEAAAVNFHLKKVGRFSSKKKKRNGEQLDSRYSIRTSKKNPLHDVDIGNDGGCCIGIYDNEVFEGEDGCVDRFIKYLESGGKFDEFAEVYENGCYMPYYLKDRATHFVEIYRGKERVGMGLMFAGKNEENEPVLAVNSIHYSDKLSSDPNYSKVVEKATDYIKDYAKQSGFKYLSLESSQYRPQETEGIGKFQKVEHWNEGFYSDILNHKGECWPTNAIDLQGGEEKK